MITLHLSNKAKRVVLDGTIAGWKEDQGDKGWLAVFCDGSGLGWHDFEAAATAAIERRHEEEKRKEQSQCVT